MPIFEVQLPDSGKTYEVDAPNIAAAYEGLKHFSGPTPPPEEGGSLSGALKATAAGLGEGLIGLAGLPGDVAELGTQGINYLTGGNLQNRVPLPTSAGIQKAVEENITGPFYKPKGTIESALHTGASFVPALAGGPETLLTKAATRVALPTIGTELAGAASDNDPYAKVAGALTGAVVGHKLTAPKPPNLEGAVEGVQQAASAQYKALNNVEFAPGYSERVSDQAQAALRREKFNDKTAGKTFAVLEELKTPAGPNASLGEAFPILNPTAKSGGKGSVKASEAFGGTASGFEDFQAARTQLQAIAGGADNIERAAATTAIKHIDQQLANIPQSMLKNTKRDEFVNLLSNARADYAVGKTGGRLLDTQRLAELQAAAANSGRNIGNTMRQKERQILTNPKKSRGLTQEEQDILENNVRGSFLQNQARTFGNYLGGGGGLGGAVTGLGTWMATGNPLTALAPPLLGRALTGIANRMAVKDAEKVVRQVLTRSPTYQKYLASLPPPDKNKLARGILATTLLGSRPQGLLQGP